MLFCFHYLIFSVIPSFSVRYYVQYLIKLGEIVKNHYCCVSSALTFDLHCHCLAGRCHSSLRSHNPCDPYLTHPSRDHCHSCTHVTGLFFISCFHSTHLSDGPLDLERLQRECHVISLMRTCTSKAIVQVKRVIHVCRRIRSALVCYATLLHILQYVMLCMDTGCAVNLLQMPE